MKQSAKIFLQFFTVICFPLLASSQASIRLSLPAREQNNVSSSKQFIAGRTCIGCKVTINNDTVHVYSTGAFAVRKDLQQGRSTFNVVTTDPKGETYTKSIAFYYNPPPAPVATSAFRIDYIDISPKGNVELSEGDTLRIKMKGYPGGKATWFNDAPLRELSAGRTGVAGVYTGIHVIGPEDSLLNGKLLVQLRLPNGSAASLYSPYRYTVMHREIPLTGRTIDNMTYLTSSPEGDRLGPDKIGYLDKGVLMHIIGKQRDYYKVRLSSEQTAFIPEPLVDTEIPQEQLPVSIISDAKIWGDEQYDYVSVELSDKMPYTSSTQIASPGKIIIDVHGVYAEQSMGNVLQNTREITQVAWGKPTPDVFRMILSLKHAPWGYKIYYEGNRLTVRVKRISQDLSLRNLTIGIDPGHGGGNPGASGLTGSSEKQLTLVLSLLLKSALEKEGARVLITRTSDQFVANEDRLSYYRNADPDLLFSIHLNSSVNPVDVNGTATYYKHPFCKPLCAAIHKRLLETGLGDFGNNDGFNFILNNPTEFPDALVETLFLSNPADEEKVLDPAFRQLMVEKIVIGLKDYLAAIKQ